MLKPGAPLPAFSLTTDTGATVSNATLKGRRALLYFYPKDDTPGCTKEACAFRDALPDFSGLGVAVYGVSADSAASHAKFVKKYGLTFPLLADPDRVLIEGVGAWVEKSMYGRSYFGIARCTVLVGADGRVEQVWDKVKPETHPAEVLAALRGDTSAAKTPAAKTTAAKQPAKPAGKTTAAKKAVSKAAAKKPAAPKKTTATARPRKG